MIIWTTVRKLSHVIAMEQVKVYSVVMIITTTVSSVYAMVDIPVCSSLYCLLLMDLPN